MKYFEVQEGIFLARPNRFIAHVQLGSQVEVCHVKNTGRCRELLIPGAKVLVNRAEKPGRKTAFDLIAVYKGKRLVNIDSQAPNQVFEEWVKEGIFLKNITFLRREFPYLGSRFDFYLEAEGQKILVEIKGVTLEENGMAKFPDAPTKRGTRHLKELCQSRQEGFQAYAVFVIQMEGVTSFSPNTEMDPEFSKAFWTAKKQGVSLLALDCRVTKEELHIRKSIPILGGS